MMKRFGCLVALCAAMVAGAALGADAKALQAEAQALMKAKSYEAAAGKFLEAALAPGKDPVRLANGYEQAVQTLIRTKKADQIAAAERRLVAASESFHGVEEGTGCGKWNCIATTEATDICDKPSRWDLVRGNEAS